MSVGQTRAQIALICEVLADSERGARRLAEFREPDAARLVAFARAHGVEAWLAGCAPRTAAWHECAEQRRRFAAARFRAVADLHSIGAVLDAIGCPWVVVKGQAVAEDLYPQAVLRHAVDNDVLVPPSQFVDALGALGEAGWTLLDRNWPLFASSVPGELRLRSPGGGLLDLHWHLISSRRLRDAMILPTEELLERSRRLPSGLRALDRTDQLVHLGIHGAFSGATRLLWLLDAGLAARAVDDWGHVAVAAHRAHATQALALVLTRASRWLGTPSGNVGATRAWRAACCITDRLSPLGGDPDQPALARSLARSARGNVGSSGAELARHALSWLYGGAPRRRQPSPLRDPTDARSPLYSAGGSAMRRRYFEAVAAESVSAS